MIRYDLKPNSKKVKILDIGWGMNPREDATHILDINKNIDKEFKEKIFICHNLNNLPLPFESNLFDYIYLTNVIHHLDIEDSLLFKELYRILKIYGKIETHDPNSFFIYHRILYFFGIMPCDFIPCHKKHYSFQQMKLNLTNAGFKIFEMNNKWLFNPFRNFTNMHIKIIAKKVG